MHPTRCGALHGVVTNTRQLRHAFLPFPLWLVFVPLQREGESFRGGDSWHQQTATCPVRQGCRPKL